MRVVVQRVKEASCQVDNQLISAIQTGYLLLVAFKNNDTKEEAIAMANKVAKLRIFSDSEGKMNLDIKSVNGSILAISQFTLYGDAKKGNRPSFTESMGYNEASPLYDFFCEYLNDTLFVPTKKGLFGADMAIKLINDGPVTIILEDN